MDNPYADEPDHRYELVDVISDDEDSVGARYEFEREQIDRRALEKKEGSYFFMSKEFTCSNGVDCDALMAATVLYNMAFEYLGNGEIMLISWN